MAPEDSIFQNIIETADLLTARIAELDYPISESDFSDIAVVSAVLREYLVQLNGRGGRTDTSGKHGSDQPDKPDAPPLHSFDTGSVSALRPRRFRLA